MDTLIPARILARKSFLSDSYTKPLARKSFLPDSYSNPLARKSFLPDSRIGYPHLASPVGSVGAMSCGKAV